MPAWHSLSSRMRSSTSSSSGGSGSMPHVFVLEAAGNEDVNNEGNGLQHRQHPCTQHQPTNQSVCRS